MCLIIYKERNTDLPKKELIKWMDNSFVKNNDGLGYMIKGSQGVIVKKGFETVKELIDSLFKYKESFLTQKELAIHLRNPSPNTVISLDTTHPISSIDEENKQDSFVSKNAIIVHNGAFREFSSSLYGTNVKTSDTKLFMEEYFKPPLKGAELFVYLQKHHEKKLSDFIGHNNKIVIFQKGYKTIKHGYFHKESKFPGIHFSNLSYEESFSSTARSTTSRSDGHFGSRTNGSNCAIGSQHRGSSSNGLGNTYTPLEDYSDFSIGFTYKSNKITSQEIKRYMQCIIPFACSTNESLTKSCTLDSLKLDEKSVCNCCKSLSQTDKDTSESFQMRQSLSQLIRSREFALDKEPFNKQRYENIVKILEFIVENPDRLEFYWHHCESCIDGYSKIVPSNTCVKCKGFGLKLGVMYLKDSQNKVIDRPIEGFRIANSDLRSTVVTTTNMYEFLTRLYELAEARVSRVSPFKMERVY